MLILKNRLLFPLAFYLFFSGCQSTKSFNLTTIPEVKQSNPNELHIINVNSNRVRQKCLFFNAEAENNWRYQYFMYVLNNKNEVLEIMESTNQDKETCYSQIRTIEKILKFEPSVKICVRDELKKMSKDPGVQVESIQFGSLGSHDVFYESLTLDSICNSKKCLSKNDVWVNTCPGFVKH